MPQEAKVGGRSAYAAELELQLTELLAHDALLRDERDTALRAVAAAAEASERLGELEPALARKQAEVGLMAQLMQARPTAVLRRAFFVCVSASACLLRLDAF